MRTRIAAVAGLLAFMSASAARPTPPPPRDDRETFAVPPATIIHTDADGNKLPPGAVARLGGGRFRYGTSVRGIALSPDGKLLVANGQFGGVRVWDVRTGKLLVRREIGGGRGTYDVVFAADGNALALDWGDTDGNPSTEPRVCRFDPATAGQSSVALTPHSKFIYGHQFSADGTRAFIVGEGHDVRLARYDTKTGRQDWEIQTLYLNQDLLISTSWDGSVVAVGNKDGQKFWVYDGKTGKLKAELQSAVWEPNHLCVSPEGAIVAVAIQQKSYWVIRNGILEPPPDGSPQPNTAVVEIWDVAAKKLRLTIPHAVPDNTGGIAFSSDGKRLVLAEAGHLTLVDLATGKDVWRIPVTDPEQPAFSADGTMIALGRNGFVSLHDAKTGSLLPESGGLSMEYLDDRHEPTTLAFSPDGRVVAHGVEQTGNYVAVRMCEVATGKVRVRYPYSSTQYAAAFSPRGDSLAVASTEGPVMLWDVWGTRTEKFAKPEADAWDRLGDADAVAAFQVMKRLAAHPDVTVTLFRKRISPVPPIDPKKVARLIDDLDAPIFTTREAASNELAAAADKVRDALIAARATATSAEQLKRLDRLLKPIDASSPDQVRIVRAVEVLERIGTSAAKKFLFELADGAPGARLTREAAASRDRLK
ncbi:MAG TPA: WD40 repeat domain-containing protein [Fimbriiglobus sp.]|jgi:WD40 repeat protein